MSDHQNHLDERAAAIQIIAELRKHSYTAYLAGGCVRDQLLGETPKDYDVATDAHPEHIAGMFKKTAAVGAAFGVMLVRDFGPTIEVATFRSDGPYSDARRPDHVHFSSPEEDAKRRDFTINALFLDPSDNGDTIIDFVNGQADIEAKVLRAVGDPDARLKEDHLRALRAVRFAARYGLTIDPHTHDAIKSHASELVGVSIERIGHEIQRMMAHPSRAIAAKMIQDLTLDSVIFQDQALNTELKALRALEESANSSTALAAWAWDRLGNQVLTRQGAISTAWPTQLDMSNTDRDQFVATLEITGTLLDQWESMSIAQQKRLANRSHCCGAIMLARCIDPKKADSVCTRIESLSNDGIGIAPAPLITGQTLIEIGHRPGQLFKEVLDKVYDAQLEGRVVSFDSACNLASELFVLYDKSDQ